MVNCVLCSEEGGTLIWRGDDCRVVLVDDPDLPGFCRVIWNRHVAEMSQLSYGERDLLMHLVFAVEVQCDRSHAPKQNQSSSARQSSTPHPLACDSTI
jgi:diadenosine tetraphosphate (Ap4A) HIT family hydrolase